jgi:branched-chain amino acid transport system substrate-binding protein
VHEPNTQPRRTARRADRALALAATSALLLAITACSDDDDGTSAPGDAPGGALDQQAVAELLGPDDPASGEPVKIGMVSDGTTQAFDAADELRAAQATVDYWNAHRGGIGDRPIQLVTCETGGEPAGATDCANQMVEDDVVAVAQSQSAVGDSLWEPVHAAGIPTMSFQTSSQGALLDAQTSFAIVNPLTTLFGLPITVARDEGTDKIAFVIIDVPQAVQALDTLGPPIMDQAGLDYAVFRVPPGTADMTAQMQQVVDSGAGVVQVTGNDAFCIAAFNGLNAVGYQGKIATLAQCITNATREAVPGDVLDGIEVASSVAMGATDDPTYQLYQAVMATYGDDVLRVDDPTAMGGYTVIAALATALDGITGDITPETVTTTIKAMPPADLPGGGGVTFQCNGTISTLLPAVCTNEWLKTSLDTDGQPTTYQQIDSTDILPQ